MNYNEIKKLDEETLEKLTEGVGPSDECLCSLFYSPEEGGKKGFRASIKRALGSLGGRKQKSRQAKQRAYESVYGQNSVDIPLTFTKGDKGIYTTKEAIKRTSPCGKCGCDDTSFALKHSYANIRITAPDIDMSSICPCPTDCMPDYKDKLTSNIKVTIEHVSVMNTDVSENKSDVASQGTGYTVSDGGRQAASEPQLTRAEDSGAT